MKVILARRILVPSPVEVGGILVRGEDPEKFECQTAYVRDGALVIIYDRDGQTIEHGIPLDVLAEWEIVKPAADAAAMTGGIPPHRQVVAPGMLDSTGPGVRPIADLPECPNCGSQDKTVRLFTCDDPGGWHTSEVPAR